MVSMFMTMKAMIFDTHGTTTHIKGGEMTQGYAPPPMSESVV